MMKIRKNCLTLTENKKSLPPACLDLKILWSTQFGANIFSCGDIGRIEQIAKLTKVLQATLQQQLQQQEKFEKLFEQQAKDNKTLLEGILFRVIKELSFRFFSAEGILSSLSEFKYNPDSGSTHPAYFEGMKQYLQKDVNNDLMRKKSFYCCRS